MTPEEFFAERARETPRFASSECARVFDLWLQHLGRPSALDPCPYAFDSDAQAKVFLSRLPLPLMVARAMRLAGYRMTKMPKSGDVGVIAFPSRDGMMAVCAVRGERLWLYRGDKGISAAGSHARVVGAWSVAP
jgi:hypothetical protein